MRIGIVVHNSLPTGGGAYTFESAVLNGLRQNRKRHDFILLNLSPNNHEEIQDIPAYDVNRLFSESASAFNAKKLTLPFLDKFLPEKIVKRLKKMLSPAPDSVSRADSKNKQPESPSVLDWAAIHFNLDIIWFIGIHFKKVSIPFVFTVYDLAHRIHPWFPEVSTEGWTWEEREKFFKSVLPKASKVITGTEVGKKEIEYFYGVYPGNIAILPFPVPAFSSEQTTNNAIDVRAEYKLPEKYFLYPAQFWAHKNHINLLMAIDWVSKHCNKKINLVLVGSDKGNKEHVQKTIERLCLQNQVRILGFIPTENLIALYKNAIGLSFVSYFGPDNLPPLEAFALGCPVIAANVEGATEQMQDAAIYVDPSNPEDIGRALVRLEEDHELCETLVSRGSEIIKSKTAKNYVDQMQNIFSSFERVRRNWK